MKILDFIFFKLLWGFNRKYYGLSFCKITVFNDIIRHRTAFPFPEPF